jgi:monofunctional biosynthetic peptidoglycan transglycosylase
MKFWLRNIFLIVVGALVLWLAYEIITFPAVPKLAMENPTTTSMIEYRLAKAREQGKGEKKQMIWVPISQISLHLQRAVLAGEDARFTEHDGFDWKAIEAAWNEAEAAAKKEAKDEGDNDPENWIPPLDQEGFKEYLWDNFGLPAPDNFKRGASTVTQQLAKNLYLSEERSFLRKGREALITYMLERNLSKRRILEIYLNVIEWGDGVYGAEAASRKYFGKSAAALSPQEAAFLSAMIPSPLNVFNPSKNPRRVKRRQNVILRGMNSVKTP